MLGSLFIQKAFMFQALPKLREERMNKAKTVLSLMSHSSKMRQNIEK